MNDLELVKIERRIYSIRGVRVILDADLAVLYGVSTKRLNEQFRRNRRRFPDDFAFQLTAEEASSLRSQFATASLAPRSIRSQNATASKRNVRYRPYAFTEHGALQAANILNSANAVHMSVFVIRAFVKMREHVAINAAILKRLAEIDKSLLVHDSALRDIYQKLLPLLSPPPDPPRRKIGFHPLSK
jgi:ORF6N domain